jgi:hypothetical protein
VSRVRVHDAEPFDAIDCRESAEQAGERRPGVDVGSVDRCVLRNQDQFPDPDCRESASFAEDIRDAAGTQPAPDCGDEAVGAVIRAAVGDPEIGVVARGAEQSRTCT